MKKGKKLKRKKRERGKERAGMNSVEEGEELERWEGMNQRGGEKEEGVSSRTSSLQVEKFERGKIGEKWETELGKIGTDPPERYKVLIRVLLVLPLKFLQFEEKRVKGQVLQMWTSM